MVLCLTMVLSHAFARTSGQVSRAEEKMVAGIGLSSLVTGKGAEICFAHGINNYWSVCAGACINIWRLYKGPSEIESKHNEDINAQIPWVEIDKDLSSFEMAVQYWIQGRRSGPFFSTGIRYGNATGLDTVFEAGIRMHILKGFGLVASIKTGIIDNIRSKSFNSNILRLGIDYSF